MQSIVTASGVSFELPNGRELFHGLSFSLDSRLTALVGPNGVGKSTLAKLLVGELEVSAGSIRRNSAITYFAQRQDPRAITVDEFLQFNYELPELSENLLEGIDRRSLCTTLSGGQWMRVRLASTLDEQFLILDEPTNDLDRVGRDAVVRFLKNRKSGILLISHDRECLELCNDVLELSNRGLSKCSGGWNEYLLAKTQERENLSRNLELAKRDRESVFVSRNEQRDRQEKRNRRGKEAAERGGMPKILLGGRKRAAQVTTGKIDAATIDRANKAIRDAHEALSELKIDPVMYADLIGDPIPSQKLVAEANRFNVKFGDWIYKQDLAFAWRGNIRIALRGTNGSGKSTLLKTIMGEKFETRGELRQGKLETLYIDQRCAGLDNEKSVLENIQITSTLNEAEIRNGLAKFLFVKESVFQKVKDLSGGERLRANLARGFLSTTKPELLIL
ncbi:MAG TPA: ATP-binding cassette domain-containing protein, partial [Bdellovibrionales bacterium]|nr:ATP-binding cassette domain-containing protein [Bdellovibrionales bacterium]